MKKLSAIIAVLFLGLSAQAQTLNMSVSRHLEEVPSDQDAAIHFIKKDKDGRKCAIVKVTTTNKLKNPLVLELVSSRVVDTKQQENGEMWYWVPSKTKNLRFICQEYNNGEHLVEVASTPLKEGAVYRMTIQSDALFSVVQNTAITTSYLKLHTEPQNVKVSYGQTPSFELGTKMVVGGEFNERLNNGKYYVRVENEYYNAKVIEYEVSPVSALVTVSLEPNFNYLNISTNPSGADVFINGEFAGKSPLTTSRRYKAGDVEVTAQKELYHTQEIRVNVPGTGSDYPVSLNLSPNFGTVTLSCDDNPQALLYVDESYVGTGNWTGALSGNTQHKVEARLAGHQPQSVSISVADGQTVSKTVPAPVPLYATLYIESEPSGARIKIDGQAVDGQTPMVKQILMGSHEIAYSLPGYQTRKLSLSLAHNETRTVNERLVKGKVYSTVKGSAATGSSIEIRREGVLVKTLTSSSFNERLEDGDYTFTARKPGYRDVVVTRVIEDGQPYDIAFPSPVMQTGDFNITANVSGARIYWGEYGSRTNKGGTSSIHEKGVPAGSYQANASKFGYRSASTSFTVSDGETTNVRFTLKRRPKTMLWSGLQMGYNISSHDFLAGASLSFLPFRLGVYGSYMYNFSDARSSSWTVGPAIRLTSKMSETSFMLYGGIGKFGKYDLYDFGMRLGWDEWDASYSKYNISLGTQYIPETSTFIPTLGLSWHIPYGMFASVFEPSWDDFPVIYSNFLMGYHTGVEDFTLGANVGVVPTHLGAYASYMYGVIEGTQSFTAGPVIRLTSEDFDWQLYGGYGNYKGKYSTGGVYDFGMKFGWDTDHGFGLGDIQIGCQITPEGAMPTLGLDWKSTGLTTGVIAVGALIFFVAGGWALLLI